MIKIIFTDMDQTLITHKDYKIPYSALEAIKEAQAKGILVFGSTGRTPMELANMPLDGFDADGWVSTNGCYNYDHEGDISVYPITREDTDTLMKYVKKYDMPVQVMMKERKFSTAYNDLMLKGLEAIHTEPDAIESIDVLKDESPLMFIPWDDPDHITELLEHFKDVRSVRWNPYAADCFLEGAGKGKGIEDVLKKYGIKKEEALALGDAPNDLSMFEAVGVRVAMGNATEEVKEQSDYITKDIDEDGFAHALRHFGIID